MIKNYYRNEYTAESWAGLIDKAHELGCVVTYSKYGNIAEIDSTAKESALIKASQGATSREMWANAIHDAIADGANVWKWCVMDSAGECVVWYKDEARAKESAREYAKHTGGVYEVKQVRR